MAERVALVTGAAGGIGAACAKRPAREGIAIGVLDLDSERCAGTVGTIKAAGGKAIALGADISDRMQVNAAAATLRGALGPITIVVNNAAIAGHVPFLEPDTPGGATGRRGRGCGLACFGGLRLRHRPGHWRERRPVYLNGSLASCYGIGCRSRQAYGRK